MPIDENEFFKTSTLKICGDLDLKEALCDCLLYVRQFIPDALHMSIHLYHWDEGIVETVVHTNRPVCPGEPIKTIISQQGRELVARQRSLRIRRFDRYENYEVGRKVAAQLGLLDLAVVIFDLVLNKTMLGAWTIESAKPLTDDHVHLLSLLVKPCAIAVTNSMRYRELRRLQELITDDNRYLQEELRKVSGEEIVGADRGLREVMSQVYQVASLDTPVLVFGETGTGKEVVASAVHRLSPRRNGPFIKVNCGAIPATLLDSELFGYEKGAFTGAMTRKKGRIERAQGGTLFLDEIGELSAEAQVRLLRVLQEKEFDRVGGGETIKADVRIIAATHRDLAQMMREQRFRADLFFRLQIFPITLPPLRERKEDIPDLVTYFISKKAEEMKRRRIPTPTEDAMNRLLRYDWPGNIRELENTVERSMILDTGDQIFFWVIGALKQEKAMERRAEDGENGKEEPAPRELALDEVNKNYIRKILDQCHGRIEGEKGAARLMNINPSTLRKKMRKLGIARKTA
ncbi:MAG: sigma-54 dependent transcriptional regulator [Desulfobulbaceae bacterium]|jgi:transcriptional regulator with GAF, ATPase, and Fis domain|nr:sigma-54 dependent transcriptional regulator [Desulfobulbaceae bacterium]